VVGATRSTPVSGWSRALDSVPRGSAVKHFADAAQLRTEIVNARLWAGLHYRFSGIAGVTLGRKVAKYDLAHAFQQVG
jgi:hypothetical protein